MRWLIALLMALLLSGAVGCGSGFEFGKRCDQDHECEGGFCFAGGTGGLPDAYCTRECGSDGCPDGFICVNFDGSAEKPACLRTADAGKFR